MPVLVDTSAWIDYFRKSEFSDVLESLLSDNDILTNDLILAELIPFLEVQKQNTLISLLEQVERLSLKIHWEGIIYFQVRCIQKGFNGLGIPDLIIAQNAIQNSVPILSKDKHFSMLKEAVGLELYLAIEK